MPPKARGRGGRGRGGTGRGGSVGTASTVPAGEGDSMGSASDIIAGDATANPDVAVENDISSGSRDTAAPAAVFKKEESSIHGASGFETPIDVDPNESPASQPTETPAPTPIRPNSQPTMAPPTTVPAAGVKVKKESRFKPKAIRSNASKLKEIEDAEREKQRKLDVEHAKAQKYAARGNALRGRGRGDAMGRGRITASAGAAGPFSGVWASESGLKGAPKRPSGLGDSSGRSGGSGSNDNDKTARSGVKYESRPGGPSGTSNSARTFSTHNGVYMPEPRYPDEEDDIQRVDIENINYESANEQEDQGYGRPQASKGKSKSLAQGGGMRPVYVAREEHKDRKANAKPDIKVEAEPDSDAVMVDENRSSQVAPPDTNVRVKVEQYESTINGIPSIHSPTTDFKQSASEMENMDVNNDEAALGTSDPKKPILNKTASTKKVMKPVFQTEEDKAEYARHLEDVEVLVDELGRLSGTAAGQDTDGDGDIDMDSQAQSTREEGRAYLFQFPPVLPVLYDPLQSSKPSPPSAKSDPNGKDDGVEMVRSADKNPIDLTKGKPKSAVKGEISVKKEEVVDESAPKKVKQAIVPDQGYIGKLVIRKSGRVVLQWGGTRLLLGRGADASFLTVSAVVDHPENKRELQKDNYYNRVNEEMEKSQGVKGKGKTPAPQKSFDTATMLRSVEKGDAMSMGQVMGKFTVTPEWDNL